MLIADLHELLLQIAPCQRVEGPKGFIQQQQLGLDRQGAGNRHPLAHAPGKLQGWFVGSVGQSHHGDVVLHHGLALRFGEVGHHLIHRQGDVLAHREPGQQRVVLEHHHLVRPGPLDGFALQQHGAIAGEIQPGDHVQQGALAATGVADQRDEFTLADL